MKLEDIPLDQPATDNLIRTRKEWLAYSAAMLEHMHAVMNQKRDMGQDVPKCTQTYSGVRFVVRGKGPTSVSYTIGTAKVDNLDAFAMELDHYIAQDAIQRGRYNSD